jgi:ASC-1-like (ASCH) protein
MNTRRQEYLDPTWFDAIQNGIKIAEGRIGKPWVLALELGDEIEFTRRPAPDVIPDKNAPTLVIKITELHRYGTFTALFDDVGLERVLPGILSYDDGVNVYRKWYSEKDENDKGVIGIFFKVL